MNKYIIIVTFFMALNCSEVDNCNFHFVNSKGKYCVNTSNFSSHQYENGRFIFFNGNNVDSFEEAGFYLNGLRNDIWFYRIGNEVKSIKWSYYKDQFMQFETNIFSEVDSIKYGDGFTKIQFKTDLGLLSVTVSVDGALKDSLPEYNYRTITKKEFESLNYKAIIKDSSIISKGQENIYTTTLTVEHDLTNQKYYLRNCFGYLNGMFIEFTVNSSNRDTYYNQILFDAILTNLFIQNKRFYNPYH